MSKLQLSPYPRPRSDATVGFEKEMSTGNKSKSPPQNIPPKNSMTVQIPIPGSPPRIISGNLGKTTGEILLERTINKPKSLILAPGKKESKPTVASEQKRMRKKETAAKEKIGRAFERYVEINPKKIQPSTMKRSVSVTPSGRGKMTFLPIGGDETEVEQFKMELGGGRRKSRKKSRKSKRRRKRKRRRRTRKRKGSNGNDRAYVVDTLQTLKDERESDKLIKKYNALLEKKRNLNFLKRAKIGRFMRRKTLKRKKKEVTDELAPIEEQLKNIGDRNLLAREGTQHYVKTGNHGQPLLMDVASTTKDTSKKYKEKHKDAREKMKARKKAAESRKGGKRKRRRRTRRRKK